MRTLFQQVQDPGHVISELLQNADDAGAQSAWVTLTDTQFCFEHDGADFTEENFRALCTFAFSNKRQLRTIGFRGIGFKSTFSLGEQVLLDSPTLRVAFAIDRFTLPVWTDRPAPPAGRTRVTIPFRDAETKKEAAASIARWLENPFSLLFLKTLRRLTLQDLPMEWRVTAEGPVPGTTWLEVNTRPNEQFLLIRSKPASLPPEALNEVRKERQIKSDSDVDPTVEIDLVLGGPPRLYVMLPTGVRPALPFTLNAPFIQDPARTGIKSLGSSVTNRWLLQRAGALAAQTLLAWVARVDLEASERARAYSLLCDASGELGTAEAAVELEVLDAFDAPLRGIRWLLTASGQLAAPGDVVATDQVLHEVWDEQELLAILGKDAVALLHGGVEVSAIRRLEERGEIVRFDREELTARLRTYSPRRPDSPDAIALLWKYLPLGGWGMAHGSDTELHIVPEEGADHLVPAKVLIRAPTRSELPAKLLNHVRALDGTWADYIASKTSPVPKGSGIKSGGTLDAILQSLGLGETTPLAKIVEKAAQQIQRTPLPDLEQEVFLAHLAAQLGLEVREWMRYVVRKGTRHPVGHGVVTPDAVDLGDVIPSQWADDHILHKAYESLSDGLTRDGWRRWTRSAGSGLAAFVPVEATRVLYSDRASLEKELGRRGYREKVEYPYRNGRLTIHDWDFPQSLKTHWNALAKTDPQIWPSVVEGLLRAPAGYTQMAEVRQRSSNGNDKRVVSEIVPAWLAAMRERHCLVDDQGNYALPHELLLTNSATAPLFGVSRFVHKSLDTEAARPILLALGVRDRVDDPKPLLDRLAVIARAKEPPLAEVTRIYQTLDAVLREAEPHVLNHARELFAKERLIRTTMGGWARAQEVVQYPLEATGDEVPTVLPALRELTLWTRLGVPERPSEDWCLNYLRRIQVDQTLDASTASLVRHLLAQLGKRVWVVLGRWLDLSGTWRDVRDLRYRSQDRGGDRPELFPDLLWATADCSMLQSAEVEATPFGPLPDLWDVVSLRSSANQVVATAGPPGWMAALGDCLARVVTLDDAEMHELREIGERICRTSLIPVPEVSVEPVVEGTPAGPKSVRAALWTGDQFLFKSANKPKEDRAIAEEMVRIARRPLLADLIKLCVGRSTEYVVAAVEDRYELAAVRGPARKAYPDVEGEGDGGSPVDDDRIEPATTDAAPPQHTTTLDEEDTEQGQSRAPHRHMPHSDVVGAFARSSAMSPAGDARFSHPDGRLLSRESDGVFNWRLSGGPEGSGLWLWVRELTLGPAGLELPSEVWSRMMADPNRYGLLVWDHHGRPHLWRGNELQRAHKTDTLQVFPASYRVKFRVDQ